MVDRSAVAKNDRGGICWNTSSALIKNAGKFFSNFRYQLVWFILCVGISELNAW